MDLFEHGDDYKPEKPLTEGEMDEITGYLSTHPLFMKELPENVEDNPHLAGLQNIIYDEDPEKVAESLNRQGNQRLQINPDHLFYMKQAYKKYTEGINLKCANNETNAKLHTNRALINIKLKNYGKVLEDCKQALKYNPNYIKAYYRYAQALIKLGRFEDSLALLKDRKENELKVLVKESEEGRDHKNKAAQEKTQAVEDKQITISKYCKERGWKMKKRTEPIPGEIKVRIVDGSLVIPMLVIYPEFGQFDVVESITESTNIWTQLSEVVAQLPWDTENAYTLDQIQVFVEVALCTMLRVNPAATVGNLLKVYEFPEAVEINVVSNKSKYYQIFRKDNKIVE